MKDTEIFHLDPEKNTNECLVCLQVALRTIHVEHARANITLQSKYHKKPTKHD